MVITSFTIELDNPSDQYQPGNEVTGQVNLVTNGEHNVSGIKLRLLGIAETYWIDYTRTTAYYHGEGGPGHYTTFSGIRHGHGHSHLRSRNTVARYYGVEVILDVSLPLFGYHQDGIDRPLPAEITLPFSIKIPNRPIFGSCMIGHSKDGTVTTTNIQPDMDTSIVGYEVEAVIEYSGSILLADDDEVRCFSPIEIIPSLDLNTISEVDIPLENRIKIATCCCCCCKTCPIEITLKIPRRAACIGELFPVSVKILNKSGKQIEDMTAKLVQEWTLIARSTAPDGFDDSNHENRFRIVVAEVKRGSTIPKGNKVVEWDFELLIPTLLPTMEESTCDIVKMRYILEVKPTKFRKNCYKFSDVLALELPLIIGHIPLKDQKTVESVVPSSTVLT